MMLWKENIFDWIFMFMIYVVHTRNQTLQKAESYKDK